MTAQKSTAKKSYFMVNFKNRLRQNRRTSIIALILHLVSAPVVLINAIIYGVTYHKFSVAYEAALAAVGGNASLINYRALPTYVEMNPAYVVIAAIATGIAVLAGIAIAMSNYSYLYKKTQVDMVYSLPMSTTERFLSDFTAGIVSYIGPFIASTVVTAILCFIGGAVCPWLWTDGLENASFGFQSITQIILQGSFYAIFFMLMIYVMCVLVISCCGSFLESGVCIVVLNGLIPATIAVAGFMFFGDLYGINIENSIIPWLTKTSPFGTFMEMFYILDGGIEDFSMWSIMWTWLLPFVFVTALYFVGALFLYKFRKAEDVSKPFVYRMFYYIIITAVTFCIATLFVGQNSLDAGLIPLIIISAIVYFIAEVIANRGFKKFWKSVIRYVITLAALVIAILVVQATDGFGIIYYVPSSSSVKSIDINYESIYYDTNMLGYNDTVRLTDRESIEAIISAQHATLDRYKAADGKNVNGYMAVSITYHLYSGREIAREYRLNVEEYHMLSGIDLTEEYINGITECMRDDLLKNSYREEIDITASYKNSVIEQTAVPVRSGAEMIYEAVREDLLGMSEEEYLKPTGKCYGYVRFDNYEFPLSESYPHILEYVHSLGFNPEKNTADTDMLLYSGRVLIMPNYVTGYYEKYNMVDYDDVIASRPPMKMSSVEYTPAELRTIDELIKKSQYKYYCDEFTYAFEIDGVTYVIPEEDYNKAEALYNKIFEGENSVQGSIQDDTGRSYYFSSYNDIDYIIESIYNNNSYIIGYVCYDGDEDNVGTYIDCIWSSYQQKYYEYDDYNYYE